MNYGKKNIFGIAVAVMLGGCAGQPQPTT